MNRLQQEISDELQGEISRDHWIAMQAAERFIEDGGPEDIETEALDALCTWIQFELLDRAQESIARCSGAPF